MAKDDSADVDVIEWVFDKVDKFWERRRKNAEERIERERQEQERITKIFLDMGEKASRVVNDVHELQYPYDSVVNNLMRIVNWFVQEARTGTTDHHRKSHEVQYIINKLTNVAHFIGCDLVKKERTEK